MPKCTDASWSLGGSGRRVIEADFSGGDLSSDGGVLLLRRVDERIGLSRCGRGSARRPTRPGAHPTQPARPARPAHLRPVLRLRRLERPQHACATTVLMQTAVGRVEALASRAHASAAWRTRATRAQAGALHGVLIEQFIASHAARAPKELVLDIDASDVPLHGDAGARRSSTPTTTTTATCRCTCSAARRCWRACCGPARIDGAKHAAAVIKLLVDAAAPGLARSAHHRARRLGLLPPAPAALVRALGRELHRRPGAQRPAASRGGDWPSWRWPTQYAGAQDQAAPDRRVRLRGRQLGHERRVITRLEYGAQGNNPRFVVTNLTGDATAAVRASCYCARGEAENRIKEAQLDLFGTRASCHRFAANQLRLLLAALAYTLMHRLRRMALAGTRARAAARPRSACACSRSARPSCATRAVCACCWPRTTRCASCSRWPPRAWLRQPLNPIQCCPRHADKQRG